MTAIAIKKLHQNIDEIKDPKLLKMLNDLVLYVRNSQSISIQQYNSELEKSEKEIDKGEFFSQTEVKKIVSKWK
ncbi:MAG: hypothetical protein RIQ33_279 [Bacteroidota bacterium]|jgi:hypothetical protein